jgi:hypothetical protein
MASVQMWMVFVEVDPSHPVFTKFRISHGLRSPGVDLSGDVLKAMPRLKVVRITGAPSVQMDGPLEWRLRCEVEAQGRTRKKERHATQETCGGQSFRVCSPSEEASLRALLYFR